MPATNQSTGPVHHYVRFGGASQSSPILYLGTAEVCPRTEFSEVWGEVKNDLGGDAPFDKYFGGDFALVTTVLNRFDEFTFSLLQAAPRHGRNAGAGVTPRGQTTRLDRGAMKIANGLSFELWLQYSFFNTANDPNVGNASALPPGFYLLACNVEGVVLDPVGTRDRKAAIAVSADQAYDRVTRGFFTYSTAPQFFQGLPNPT